MRRLEQDPEEIRQEEDALSRAATPTHEQITEEIDTQEILLRLGQTAEFGASLAQPLQAFGEFYPLDVLRGLQAEIDARQKPPDNEWES